MQKQVIGRSSQISEPAWLDLENEAAVEVTSEHPGRPIESALRPGSKAGWLAADPGPQIIRLIFNQPQHVSRVRLKFTETETERTQEFVLRWASDRSRSPQEILRQQWNFSPHGSTTEVEDYRVNLEQVVVLELDLNADVSGREAFASLDEFRVA